MPTPLAGLGTNGGLTGFVETDPEATPEQLQGGPADPRHAIPGEQATPYPWERFPGETHGPYGIENEMLGFDVAVASLPAGMLLEDPTADQQPLTHAAPWPKGVPTTGTPEEEGPRREESYGIHSADMGADRRSLLAPTQEPQNDVWEDFYDVTPGEQIAGRQATIPGQIKAASGGWGTTDRIQSFARQNSYGFDSAHMHRRYAAVGTGAYPGNYMWMRPGSRPLVKSIPGTHQVPVGAGSPFEGQDPTVPFTSQGAVLRNLPAAYQGPPEPALATGYSSVDPPAIDFY